MLKPIFKKQFEKDLKKAKNRGKTLRKSRLMFLSSIVCLFEVELSLNLKHKDSYYTENFL